MISQLVCLSAILYGVITVVIFLEVADEFFKEESSLCQFLICASIAVSWPFYVWVKLMDNATDD